MDDPSQQDPPEHGRKDELDHGHSQSTLNELTQPRDEEAADCRQYVPSGSLPRHGSPPGDCRRPASGSGRFHPITLSLPPSEAPRRSVRGILPRPLRRGGVKSHESHCQIAAGSGFPGHAAGHETCVRKARGWCGRGVGASPEVSGGAGFYDETNAVVREKNAMLRIGVSLFALGFAALMVYAVYLQVQIWSF